MINDSGVLCSGRHGNKSEIGTLIRNTALRGKGERGSRRAGFHIMREYISRNGLCASGRVSLGHFLFFSHSPPPTSLALNTYENAFWEKGVWVIIPWLFLIFNKPLKKALTSIIGFVFK